MSILKEILKTVFKKRPTYSNDDRHTPAHELYNGLSKSQIRQYKEDMEVKEPPGGHQGHDLVWTKATGVWHCRDCHVWYRTWEDHPSEVKE